MAVVSGMDRVMLQRLLDEFNTQNIAKPEVAISLENTPTLFVLSGNPEDLLQFRIKYFDLFKTENFNWYYLDITAPFHSHFMPNGLEDFKKDLQKINFQYSGKDLKIPVFDTYTGRNLQEIDSLGEYLFELQVSRPLIWKNAILPLIENPSITHVVDFGPGRSSSFFTQEILGNREIEILTVAGRAGLKSLLRNET